MDKYLLSKFLSFCLLRFQSVPTDEERPFALSVFTKRPTRHLMLQLHNALRLFTTLLVAVTLVGCDSGGGDGGNGLGDSVTMEVDGSSEASVSGSVTFYYNTDDGFCATGGTGTAFSGSPPLEETLSPSSSGGTCPPEGTEPSDFDGAQGSVSLRSGPEDITVTLLSDGNQLDQATEPNDSGTLEGFWVVEGGDVPDLSDLGQ